MSERNKISHLIDYSSDIPTVSDLIDISVVRLGEPMWDSTIYFLGKKNNNINGFSWKQVEVHITWGYLGSLEDQYRRTLIPLSDFMSEEQIEITGELIDNDRLLSLLMIKEFYDERK